jgi:predicted DNA-binding WGR domain protein
VAGERVQWYVYRKWGRVGTTIGGDKKEKFSSIDSAKAAFVKIYEARDHLCLFAYLMHARTCRVV